MVIFPDPKETLIPLDAIDVLHGLQHLSESVSRGSIFCDAGDPSAMCGDILICFYFGLISCVCVSCCV